MTCLNLTKSRWHLSFPSLAPSVTPRRPMGQTMAPSVTPGSPRDWTVAPSLIPWHLYIRWYQGRWSEWWIHRLTSEHTLARLFSKIDFLTDGKPTKPIKHHLSDHIKTFSGPTIITTCWSDEFSSQLSTEAISNWVQAILPSIAAIFTEAPLVMRGSSIPSCLPFRIN